jgi:16S rRNA (cytosine1402-N4)-methyltransferase
MEHISVLKKEILDCFSYIDRKSGYFIDGTLGLAGHSLSLVEKHPNITIVGIDQDSEALQESQKRIEIKGLNDHFILVHNNFKNTDQILTENKLDSAIGAILDLGVSSLQLDKKERGFSFQDKNQPLDMRMDKEQNKTAADVLNSYPRNELENILNIYGEEKFSRRISENIALFRSQKTIRTVGDLLEILENSIPVSIQKKSKNHFATKTFQAIRIEVNAELNGLDKAILDIFDALSSGSRLAIISFHSLEDRIVKEAFRKIEKPCQCPPKLPCICDLVPQGRIITKKPLIASSEEIGSNPRSRSAKLRIIEKI